jgi:hypothetical protein
MHGVLYTSFPFDRMYLGGVLELAGYGPDYESPERFATASGCWVDGCRNLSVVCVVVFGREMQIKN